MNQPQIPPPMDLPMAPSFPKPPEETRFRPPALRFTPTAWAKLQYLCHRGSTEIGGFGLSDPSDLLRVVDVLTVRQMTTAVTVAFDDTAVADMFEDQVASGRRPEQFGRLWLHTHPGESPAPSGIDEATFQRVFGGCDWAVMAILARGGATYARLRFNVGPGGQLLLPVEIDYSVPFGPSDQTTWEREYLANVQPASEIRRGEVRRRRPTLQDLPPEPLDLPDPWEWVESPEGMAAALEAAGYR